MNKIFLIAVILCLGATLANAQFVPPIGNKDGTVQVLGGMKVDSALSLPRVIADARYKAKWKDTVDAIFADKTTGDLKFMKNGVVVKAMTGFDSNAVGGYISFTQKGSPNGVATLGADGKIPSAQVQVVAISKVYVDTTVAQMLSHTSDSVGTVSVRIDSMTSFILYQTPASLYSNWKQLSSTPVSSFNGRTGVVIPMSNDYNTDSVFEGDYNLYYTDERVTDVINNDTVSKLATQYDISLKLNKSDTASLSNRINQKLNISDTSTFVVNQDRLDDSCSVLRALHTPGVTRVKANGGLVPITITDTGTITMPDLGTAGTYGSATQVPVITTDAKGRVIAVTNTAISGLSGGFSFRGDTVYSSNASITLNSGHVGYYIRLDATLAGGKTITMPTSGLSARSIMVIANSNTSLSPNVWSFNAATPIRNLAGGDQTSFPNGTVLRLVWVSSISRWCQW